MNGCNEDSLHLHLLSDASYDHVEARLDDPNKLNAEGYSLLHVAAWSRKNNSRIVQLLLERGANVNKITPEGHTPLHFAVCSRKRDTIDTLIESGADVNSEDFLGRTALHFSVCKRWPLPPSPLLNLACDMWVVEKLLRHPEINVNPADETEETPLMWAVKEKHSDAVRALLKAGANPNIPDIDGRTALHEALSARNLERDIVISLLSNGAGIYCEDKFRRTPIDFLIGYICNGETRQFVMECVRLIAFRYQIRGSLERKLERFPELSYHLQECCKEVRFLKRVVIYDRFTLYDFALDCFQESVEDPTEEIYLPVVEFLLSGFCSKYFEVVFSRISLGNLRSVLRVVAGDWFSIGRLLPDASDSTTFDVIERFYEENLELKSRLRAFKAYFMKKM